VLVELRSNNDYTNDHYIPYPSKVRGLGSLIILTIKIITTMTKKELNEIIDFLTEECIYNIQKSGDTTFKPITFKETLNENSIEKYIEKTNPKSFAIFEYYCGVRSYFINQLLAKDKKELTQEEYRNNFEKYNYEFMVKFGESLEGEAADLYYADMYEDDEEELDYDQQVAKIYKEIDLLDEEYIKKIVDEIGCCSYSLMDSDSWLEEFDEEGERFTPKFKKARKLLIKYFDRRDKLMDKLVEVEGGDPNNYYIDLNHAFAQKYIEYWTSKE
jgi:hypothetical protein